ncbi:O-succinylbenzoate synthase [Leucobacter luti]|uniref:o-succinylbenzoate synthase n=1 Tax=Leucobacter luti TaxID=340320 RepID=UPI00104B264D|nr:o-succinylbenzoate synthase [Leucobacter luti]MCW2288993.1 O-succinylbenzoate synthase [Leucobacter luti]TCK44857.1 O-succinylbenzoate synthase [Leucobacter luti]
MTHLPAEIPPLAEVFDTMRVVSIPTRTRFRGIAVREAAIFDAPRGPSEFSPFTEYADPESAQWLAAALNFGWCEQPAPLRDRIDVNATVPAVAPAEVAGILARFPGCRTAKVKVAERGQSLAEDVARVREVRVLMGPTARIRVDANTGWSVHDAVAALTALAQFDLDYAEQPCATVPELVEVRQRLAAAGVPVRIAADESVRKATDPLAVARAGAADLIIVKAQPLGGVSRALEIVREAGLPVVVSSALDTSVGIAMGAQLAASLPAGTLAGACGLGTVALLEGDVTETSVIPVQGSIPVDRPVLSPLLLNRYAASPERTAWWRERVARCHALLAAHG